MQILIRLIALAVLASSLLRAAEEKPVRLDRAKLAEIPKIMDKLAKDGVISGAVTLVGTSKGPVAVDSVGFADIANKQSMHPDTIFWIASMTKPMTAFAIAILQDEGKVNIEERVEKYLPEFKNQWMIKDQSKDQINLVRPPRPITLHDLLTHTSGMGDVPAPRADCTLAELVMAYSQQPLRFVPGSKWEYCNAGINTLGRIIEVASGESYADYMEKHVFHPLGMHDTTFWPNASQARRVAASYKPGKKPGTLDETTIYFLKGPLQDRHRTPFPAGGLFSTAPDVAKFYEMMLNKGFYNGKRILSPVTLSLLTKTESKDVKTGFVDGMSWGFGFQVIKEPVGINSMLSKGTFGHGGAYATQSWADPKQDLVLVLMIQRAGFPNGDASPVRQAFQDAVGAAILPPESPAN